MTHVCIIFRYTYVYMYIYIYICICNMISILCYTAMLFYDICHGGTLCFLPRHSLVTRFPEGREATNALKSLCDLRRVVVISENPLEDENVKKLLLLLKQTVRPSQLLLMEPWIKFGEFSLKQGWGAQGSRGAPSYLLCFLMRFL